MNNFEASIEIIALIVEAVGVLTIFLGAAYSLLKFIKGIGKKNPGDYIQLRQSLGRSILLGLEILIAADIMYTVVTEPTLRSVGILGLIVLIRTFLSVSLQVELEGRFPWQPKPKT